VANGFCLLLIDIKRPFVEARGSEPRNDNLLGEIGGACPALSCSKVTGRRTLNNAMPGRRSQGTRVVSIGTDSNLLALRQAVLELGGFEVLTTSSMRLAQALMKRRRCGVLLLCYSVPENWKTTLIQSFRESCPEGHIVGIVRGGLEPPSDDFDKVISSTDKADALLEAISGEHHRQKAS
jgi:hypothetical protein